MALWRTVYSFLNMCREVFRMGELVEERAVLFAMNADSKVMGVFELSKGNTDSTMVDIHGISIIYTAHQLNLQFDPTADCQLGTFMEASL